MPLITLGQSFRVDAITVVVDGVETVVRGVLAQLPQILLAIVVFVVFLLIGRAVAGITRRSLSATTDRDASFLDVMGRLAKALTIFVGMLVALVIAVPSIDLATLIGGLGISSIAIGFAFKDILQNTLAGLLLLFRQPFEVGDQIEVQGLTGAVEAITIRETWLKTFDGQRILIPNSDVYSSSVRVQTAYPMKRVAVVVGVDYYADLARAQQIAVDVVSSIEGVEQDPPVEALYTELGTSTVNFDVRYWAASRQLDARRVQDRVVQALTNALNEADIAMPADIIELDARVSFSEAVKNARSADRAADRS